MIFRRLYHDRLAQASYLIACEATRRAIVIDPLRDPTACLEAAAFEDVRIELVTETHVHADFLSGAETLAKQVHAELHLSDLEVPLEASVAMSATLSPPGRRDAPS